MRLHRLKPIALKLIRGIWNYCDPFEWSTLLAFLVLSLREKWAGIDTIAGACLLLAFIHCILRLIRDPKARAEGTGCSTRTP